MRYLPFKLTIYRQPPPLPKQPLLFGYHPAKLGILGGEIEMSRGADIPAASEPDPADHPCSPTRAASAASPTDTRCVFNLGDSKTSARQWALFSHPAPPRTTRALPKVWSLDDADAHRHRLRMTRDLDETSLRSTGIKLAYVG